MSIPHYCVYHYTHTSVFSVFVLTNYLMYSSGFYAARTYSLGYAVSDSPLGPYKKSADNPFLHSEGELSGPGHNSVVTVADGTEYCVFHVHTDPEHPSQDRRMCFCPIVFEKGRIRQL